MSQLLSIQTLSLQTRARARSHNRQFFFCELLQNVSRHLNLSSVYDTRCSDNASEAGLAHTSVVVAELQKNTIIVCYFSNYIAALVQSIEKDQQIPIALLLLSFHHSLQSLIVPLVQQKRVCDGFLFRLCSSSSSCCQGLQSVYCTANKYPPSFRRNEDEVLVYSIYKSVQAST